MSVLDAAVPSLVPLYTDSRWKAMFGLSLSITEDLWSLPELDCSAEHLLWFLFYVKVYPTDCVGAVWAKCDEKTWRKHVKTVAASLNASLPPVSEPFLVLSSLNIGSFASAIASKTGIFCLHLVS
jgi:hypothetical protein